MATHNYKPGDADLVELTQAAKLLKEANTNASTAKKNQEAAKEKIAAWLKENRKLNLDELPIGDVVLIDGVALIKIGKRRTLDVVAFKLKEPSTFAAYERDFPVKNYDPLA